MKENKKFTTFTFTQRMGMEGVGDMEQVWMTQQEIEESIRQDKEKVQRLKDSGEYGKEYTTTISIEYDPTIDNTINNPTESYNFTVINFKDGK